MNLQVIRILLSFCLYSLFLILCSKIGVSWLVGRHLKKGVVCCLLSVVSQATSGKLNLLVTQIHPYSLFLILGSKKGCLLSVRRHLKSEFAGNSSFIVFCLYSLFLILCSKIGVSWLVGRHLKKGVVCCLLSVVSQATSGKLNLLVTQIHPYSLFLTLGSKKGCLLSVMRHLKSEFAGNSDSHFLSLFFAPKRELSLLNFFGFFENGV